MAAQFCRWDPALKMIGLRFSNVMDPADYARSRLRRRPAAAQLEPVGLHRRPRRRAGRAAGAGDRRPGLEVFMIATPDTVMSRSSAGPGRRGVPRRPGDRASSASTRRCCRIDKARRVLGYAPHTAGATRPSDIS